MTDGGIKLGLNKDGEPSIIEDEDKKQECLGGVRCLHAKKNETEDLITLVCHFNQSIPVNVFTFEHCPAKKWHSYKDVRSPQSLTRAGKKTGCYSCGGQEQWRLKGKKNIWICSSCHPPKLFTKSKIQTRKYKNERRKDKPV